MPLSKSKGNMYDWVTHTHSHLGGVCPHKCSYCYVQAIEKRFGKGKYAGELRLIDKELDVKYGSGRTIFIEHCNDLWADDVPNVFIAYILDHCCKWPDNTYIFQTKNPARFNFWLDEMPDNRLLGCTVETTSADTVHQFSCAPAPRARLEAMKALAMMGERIFITIEPILRGNAALLAEWMAWLGVEFVNVGADSKGTGLIEPSGDQVRVLLSELKRLGVKVREKRNLERLLDPDSGCNGECEKVTQ